MAYNRFYMRIVLSVILIALFSAASIYFFIVPGQHASMLAFGIMVFLVVGNLIYFLNRTNRILGTFLVYLRENDPTLTYTRKYIDKNFTGFSTNLNEVLESFRDIRIEKEMQARYISAIVENINAGIIVFDLSGEIKLINTAARKLLNIGEIHNIADLNKVFPEFADRIMKLKPSEPFMEKLSAGGELLHLAIKLSIIRSEGSQENILTIHDIKNEMEEQEIESWKKLIRVINHEIMNSITPVTTLTLAIRKKFTKKSKAKPVSEITEQDVENALSSAEIIEERSRGLVEFIDKYRRLTKLPPLKISSVDVNDLFERMKFLFSEQLDEKGIRLETDIHQKSSIKADARLIEQVLINLIKNAIEAMDSSQDPVIRLNTYMNNDWRPIISITDAGCGMDQEKMQQLFVPFYTTKEEGSGIGLNLCRQIMRLHKGEIMIQSEGTTVTLQF